MNDPVFDNRRDAGRQLARRLEAHRGDPEAIVLALPRGGVPVAYEVARALNLPLDVFTVRKLGLPDHPECAMGALATGGSLYLDRELIRRLQVPPRAIETAVDSEKRELARRERRYRAGRPPLSLRDRLVILVDDGLATGASLLAAVSAMRSLEPKRIVVAVPVAAAASAEAVAAEVDELVCVVAPRRFHAVGQWYADFGQTSDEEVEALLSDSR